MACCSDKMKGALQLHKAADGPQALEMAGRKARQQTHHSEFSQKWGECDDDFYLFKEGKNTSLGMTKSHFPA